MLRAWIVVFVCFIMTLMGAGPVYYAYGNYAVAWQQEFGASRSLINIGFTMVGLLGNIGGAPIGMLLDRVNVRHLAAFGMGGTAIGLALIGLCQGIWPVIILFSTLVAMADICIGVVITSYLVSFWFERRRGLALGLSITGTAAAGMVFPPLTDALFHAVGWRGTFFIYGAVMAVMAVPVWLLATLPAQMPESERLPARSHHSATPLPLKTLFTMPAFWIISIGAGAVTGANTGVIVSLVGFAKERGLSTADGSFLVTQLATCALVAKLCSGVIADRLGHRLALRAGVALAVLGMVVLAPARSYWQMVAGVCLFGLGLGSMLPVWGGAIAATVGLPSLGRALGWSRVIWGPISIIFPTLAGWIFDRTGDYGWAWAIFAGILGLALLSTFLWRDQPHGRPVGQSRAAA